MGGKEKERIHPDVLGFYLEVFIYDHGSSMTVDQKSAAFPPVKADLTTAAQVDVFCYFLSSYSQEKKIYDNKEVKN